MCKRQLKVWNITKITPQCFILKPFAGHRDRDAFLSHYRLWGNKGMRWQTCKAYILVNQNKNFFCFWFLNYEFLEHQRDSYVNENAEVFLNDFLIICCFGDFTTLILHISANNRGLVCTQVTGQVGNYHTLISLKRKRGLH